MSLVSRVVDWWASLPPATAVTGASPAVDPSVTAAAGRVALAGPRATSPLPPWGFGPALEPFTVPASPWFDRDMAMTLPTIQRAHDLIVSAVSALPFTLWVEDPSAVPIIEQQVPPLGWMRRPDPNRTRQYLLGWTADDLYFYGLAHWEITDRYAPSSGGYPSAFARIPPGALDVRNDGTVFVDDGNSRREIRAADVVEFLSPIDGILTYGYRAISIALQLDGAADRFAANTIPTGVLQEKDGSEDMSGAELAAEGERFTMARYTNTTAALNKYLEYIPISYDADKMQLVQSRQYQALELARIGNVPPYLVGAPTGTGMTYQNAQQAKGDLIDFGAAPIIACIEQTLSGPNVTPRGQSVRLDQNAWLRNPFTTPAQAVESPNDMQIADPTQPEVVPAGAAVPA
jgi:hypothetical protein